MVRGICNLCLGVNRRSFSFMFPLRYKVSRLPPKLFPPQPTSGPTLLVPTFLAGLVAACPANLLRHAGCSHCIGSNPGSLESIVSRTNQTASNWLRVPHENLRASLESNALFNGVDKRAGDGARELPDSRANRAGNVLLLAVFRGFPPGNAPSSKWNFPNWKTAIQISSREGLPL